MAGEEGAVPVSVTSDVGEYCNRGAHQLNENERKNINYEIIHNRKTILLLNKNCERTWVVLEHTYCYNK